jgi:hypothetical protein
MHATVLSISPLYRAQVYFTLFTQQFPAAILGLLMLDGGRSARVCGVAMLSFWLAAALIVARRPATPEKADLIVLRWGFLPLLALVALLARLV